VKLDLAWAKEAPTRKQLLLGGGHLAALWAITFVQPLLDLLGKNPDFFIARGNSPGDILILSIGFTLLPPLVMLAVEWVATRIAPQVYYAVHFLFFWGIATFLFIQILSNFFEKPTILLVLLSLILGALFAYAVFRVVFLKNLMDILIIAPAVILLLFIFASDASKAIFPEEESIDIGAKVESKTPVVMVVMDELGNSTLMTKQGEIDAQRFPNFAELAKTSTWFPNQTTTSYFTPTAVPGILTGNVPDEDALPTAADQPDNIFALLSGSYDFHVEEPITSICPASLCPEADTEKRQLDRLKSLYSDLKYVEGRLVLPPRIAATLPDVGTNFEGFGGGEDADEEKKGSIDDLFVKGRGGAKAPSIYSDFIRKIPASDSAFTMMHVKQPHQPWKYDTEGIEYNGSPIEQLSDSTGPWVVDDAGIASAQQRHIVQTGFADNLLGQVVDRLKATGVWDRAMVIVLADHGIDFQGGDIPQRMAGTDSMGEVANPPLFIKYPGQDKGVKDPVHSMTLDVVPTIAEELGVEGMYETDGVPLQSGEVPERDVTVKDVKNRTFSLPIEQIIRQRNAAIADKDRRFGAGPFYTLGPAPELIGEPAPASAGNPGEATLDSPGIWDDYVPGEGLLPIFVNGTISGGSPGELIAVGVNGRIQGTARSFDFEGARHFGTLVDPESLRPGRNEITVYRVAGNGRLTLIGSNQG
jgi:hypothetical protein